jgi:hypothetical protein
MWFRLGVYTVTRRSWFAPGTFLITSNAQQGLADPFYYFPKRKGGQRNAPDEL